MLLVTAVATRRAENVRKGRPCATWAFVLQIDHCRWRSDCQPSVQTDEYRQEVFKMGKTTAQSLREEGAVSACQEISIRQLRKLACIAHPPRTKKPLASSK